MADLDFFFDPICPWAWQTSRWVRVVAGQRDIDVTWRFIALRFVNEHRDYATEMPAGYEERHGFGLRLLRVAAAVRQSDGNGSVDAFYRACGEVLHHDGLREELAPGGDVRPVLAAAGMDAGLAAAADDTSHDALIREETAAALDRTGGDVGTPTITFDPPDGPSFFGPIISDVPDGPAALEAWDAIAAVARIATFAELKRTTRARPRFEPLAR